MQRLDEQEDLSSMLRQAASSIATVNFSSYLRSCEGLSAETRDHMFQLMNANQRQQLKEEIRLEQELNYE